jgi:hypothetical protein
MFARYIAPDTCMGMSDVDQGGLRGQQKGRPLGTALLHGVADQVPGLGLLLIGA